jgi:hypothetical protein
MMRRMLACAVLACLPALAALQLSVARTGAVCDPLVAIEMGTSGLTGKSLKLSVTNTGTSVVTLKTLAFETADAAYFSVTDVSQTLPISLVSQASLTFRVKLTPTTAGTYLGRLHVNDETYKLKSVVDAAAGDTTEQPMFSIVVTPSSLASGDQATVVLKFDGPAVKNANGLLKLDFIGKGDPAIQFVAPAGRSVPFKIAEGEDAAKFTDEEGNVAASITVQAGSTEGSIILTATLDGETEPATLVIPAAPVWVDSIRSTNTSTSLTLSVSGFDNTRSATRARFTFLSSSGATLAGPLTADVTDAFAAYFKNAELGGMFVLRATFPITGDVTLISSVKVELTNSAGVTTASAKIAE